MVEPVVVPRSEHTLSRRQVDPDALKVLYRLKEAGYTAYLVGGSVRDLLLGRRPKDFDIGTSAHPYQVKRLFRNCWIIGRRFRLAHVKFGDKVIEVATFRRLVPPDEPPPPDEAVESERDLLIRRDNTFGTPEEDAFRRDFTVNALIYDIATFSIIDYVGGLEDLRAGIVRSIGDPVVRFREDPVRMFRAVALAARLQFEIDAESERAIAECRDEIARSAPARLLEEYYKVLRTGAAEAAFRKLSENGLLQAISPGLARAAGNGLWESLGALDRFRHRFEKMPVALTNPVLLGSLLVPVGFAPVHPGDEDAEARQPDLGMLPVPRRDRERLTQILLLLRRLQTIKPSPRLVRSLVGRASFGDTLTWLEIHGQDPAVVARWRELAVSVQPGDLPPVEPQRRRRRRSRRRPRPVQGNE